MSAFSTYPQALWLAVAGLSTSWRRLPATLKRLPGTQVRDLPAWIVEAGLQFLGPLLLPTFPIWALLIQADQRKVARENAEWLAHRGSRRKAANNRDGVEGDAS